MTLGGCDRPMRGWSMLIVLMSSPALAAESQTTADLALQARAILHKYCAECHRSAETRIGELSVWDRTGLDRPDRPFLVPGSAVESQIWRLIEDGSMPPGTRPKPNADERETLRRWIDAQAPSFPHQFDESYVRQTILADIEKRPAEQRGRGRYFSLHHLVKDGDISVSLEPQRSSLRQAITQHSRISPDALEVIDGSGTVFRVDLTAAGWDARPFQRRELVDGREKLQPSSVNLFDLILIDYPLATWDPDEPTFRRLIELFLRPAEQLVPVLYLRGDWFVEHFVGSATSLDIARYLQLQAPVRLANRRNPLLPSPNVPGRPIRPLDARDSPDSDRGEKGFGVLFDVWSHETRATARSFHPGDRLLIYVRPTRDAYIQIVWHNADGTCSVPNLGINELLGSGVEAVLGGATGQGYRLKRGVIGRERIVLFASEDRLPPTEHLKSKDINERVIHRFYRLPGERRPDEADPERIIRKSVEFDIREP